MLNPDTCFGYAICSYTLVGIGSVRKYPLEYGNCFSVFTQKETNSFDDSVNIVNFVYENLEHLLEQGTISWPIKIIKLNDRTAVINDIRIPDEYYAKRFCEVCTPLDLLPVPQRLKHLRDIERGDREERPNGIIVHKIKPRQ